MRKWPAAVSGSCAESSHADERVPTQMDLAGFVPHRMCSLSQSSKVFIPVESVLGVICRPRFRLSSPNFLIFPLRSLLNRTVANRVLRRG